MKSHSLLLATLGALAAPATAAVDTADWKCESCPYPKGTSGTVEAGLGAVSDASAPFGNGTGLQRQGAHLVLGGTLVHRAEGGYFADLSAADLGLDRRSLAATAGREGLGTLRLGYAEIPRHFFDGAMTPFVGGAQLSLPAGFPAATTAAMPLSTTLQPLRLGFDRKRYDLAGTLNGGANWSYALKLRRDERDGNRPTSGAFFSTASAFAAPVQQTTDQLEVSASYASRKLQLSLAYQLSQFRNSIDALTWQDPFLPVVAGASRGQLAQAPDNQFHQLVASAGYQITPTIRASADVAFGRLTQNAPYLAPTLNASLAPSVPALPASSLDGQVDTFNGSFRLTAAPIEGLRLNASYARDVRDNQTAVLSYTGVATDMFVSAQPRQNTPFSLMQDRFKLAADYRVSGTLKLSAGAKQDMRNRSYTEVVDSRETTLWGRLSLQPREDLSLAFKLAHAERSHSSYGTALWFGSTENPLLRKFNLAERQRDSAGLRADFTLNAKVALGLTLDYANDNYRESLIGLRDARSVGIGVDMVFAISEQTRLHAFAQGESIRSNQNGSQTAGVPDWAGRNKDRFEVLGLGLKHAAIPDKLDIGADLVFSRSRSATEVQTAVGEPAFPLAKTAVDSVKFYASYKLKDNLWLKASYWYEAYDAQDWRVDGLLPATVPNLLALGQQAPHYRVSVVQLSLRYRF